MFELWWTSKLGWKTFCRMIHIIPSINQHWTIPARVLLIWRNVSIFNGARQIQLVSWYVYPDFQRSPFIKNSCMWKEGYNCITKYLYLTSTVTLDFFGSFALLPLWIVKVERVPRKKRRTSCIYPLLQGLGNLQSIHSNYIQIYSYSMIDLANLTCWFLFPAKLLYPAIL